jgi:steroid delta-isomerase-like uncharacterized protein
MSAKDNMAAARRLLDEGWSQGKLDVVDELVADSYVFRDPAVPGIEGTEGLKQLITMYRTGYPDLKFTLEDQLADGDKVVNRWTCAGTHEGELMGIPATGKYTTTSGISISRFEGGKAVEEWVRWDTLGWLQQLGVIPPLGGG